VDVHSPLCTNKRHTRQDDGGCNGDNGSCGSTMCLDAGESDLASLDNSFLSNTKSPLLSTGCYNRTDSCSSSNTLIPSGTVPNMKNGLIYKVPAFFIRRRGATQTILFSHGNAEDLGMMYNRMRDLAMVLGVNILAYDYTGYGLSIPGPAHGNGMTMDASGRSSGSADNSIEGPSENMCYRNIEAAFRYLTETRKIPPHQIILYGRSLGSGPSCYLAAKTALNGNSVGGLILHSPFLSVYKVVADLNGLDLGVAGDIFNNEKRAKNLRCPTLIIHGKDDEVVPFFHAQRLLAAIPNEFRASPYYVDNMGHNHIESKCRETYVKTVLNFIQMNVWNSNRQGQTGQSYGVANTTSVQEYRGPLPLPPHERASPNDTKENASFYVNQTWIRHAKVLISTAIVDAGCSVNTSSERSHDSRSSERSSAGQRSACTPAGRTSPVMDRYSMVYSDARDDEDEMAPWRSNQQQATRKETKVLTPRLFASRVVYNRAQSSPEINTVSILKARQSPRRGRKSLDLMNNSRQGGRI